MVRVPAPGVWSRNQKGNLAVPLKSLLFLYLFYALILGFFFFYSLSCRGDPAELSSLFLATELLFQPHSGHRELWDLPPR